jgi:hypothetical protein
VQVQGEDEREQWADDEARQCDAERGDGGNPERCAAAAPHGARNPARDADEHRQHDRGQPERGAQGQPLADELAHGEIPLAQRHPEIPAREPGQIMQVLQRQRPVQAVDALEIGSHRGAEGLLLVERAARRQADDGEGNADDDEQGEEDSGETSERVAQHVRL